MYAVSSSLYQSPQYQYVMDIVSGSDILTRVKQFPNPAGSGIFNVAHLLNDYLEYEPGVLNASTSQGFGKSLQNFTIKFGEEYGTSPSSSVQVYDGQGQVGNPKVSGSLAEVFPGSVDPNNISSSYNWTDLYSSHTYLTEYKPLYPSDKELYKPVGKDDYAVIGHYGGGTASIYVYNSAGTLIHTEGMGSLDTFAYIPVGGQNLLDAGMSQSDLNDADYMYVYMSGHSGNYLYYINSFGAWDHYGVNLPTKRTTNIERKEVTTPHQNWSTATSPFDGLRRGTDVYHQKVTDRFSISTNWLDQNQASWLSYLIESPEVYIQNGSVFNPIVITNASYTHNTNTRSQKAFQFEISWKYANHRPSR
jgi:hypothetical protein